MDILSKKFETKIVIFTKDSNLEKIIHDICKKYGSNNVEYYIERPLTKREAEIMKLVIAGDSNTEIANNLHITKNTVKVHLSKIFEKLAVKDRVQAAVKVVTQNLI